MGFYTGIASCIMKLLMKTNGGQNKEIYHFHYYYYTDDGNLQKQSAVCLHFLYMSSLETHG